MIYAINLVSGLLTVPNTTRPNRISKDLNSMCWLCLETRDPINLVKSLLTARHIKLGKGFANSYDWISTAIKVVRNYLRIELFCPIE